MCSCAHASELCVSCHRKMTIPPSSLFLVLRLSLFTPRPCTSPNGTVTLMHQAPISAISRLILSSILGTGKAALLRNFLPFTPVLTRFPCIRMTRDCILSKKVAAQSGDGLEEGHELTKTHRRRHPHTGKTSGAGMPARMFSMKSGETGSHDEAAKPLLWK